MLNLEPVCARFGRQIIDGQEPLKDQENTITKALGVLAENGLYAMSVYLLTFKERSYGERVLTSHLAGLWQELGLINCGQYDASEMLTQVSGTIADDLPRLILARKVTENALVFARYHAKAEIRSENNN